MIGKSSIAKALICDKAQAHCQQTLAITVTYNHHQLRGFILKASSWPASKLEILGHSTELTITRQLWER